jgi:hypothetical protein
MSQEQRQDLVRGDTYQKLSGVGFIIGAVLFIIGSLLLPRTANLGDVQAMQKAYSEQTTLLQACALLFTFGFLAVMAGTSGIYQSITKEGAAWARLGFYFHLVGVTLWMVGMSLDISYPAAIINWLEAPASSKEVAYSVVTVLSPLGFGRGIFPLNVMINWLAFTFLGVGMIRSFVYPYWMGWGELILGVIGVVLGIIMTFTGREALINVFVVFMLLNILWWLTCGIWVIRKAWLQKTKRG